MTRFLRTFSAVTLAVLGIASAAHAADQEVRIGFAGPLTGPSGRIGKDLENGARLAIDDANRARPVIGGRAVTFTLVPVFQ